MEEDLIELQGIFEKGYGLIPKLVMQDRDIPIHAKGLYAYLCSFSGKGKDVFPSRDKICYDLDISKNVLTKYLNILKTKGYITITQNKDDRNRFCNNIYKINILLPCPTFPCTEISVSAEMTPNNNNINNNNNNKKENIIKERRTKRFVPPSLEEIEEYCKERNNNVDPEKFKNYYDALGWTLGRNKAIKDWKACVRTWERNDYNSAQTRLQGKELEFGIYQF